MGKRQNDEESMDWCELSSCLEKGRMGNCDGKGLSFIAVVHIIALWVCSLKYEPQGAGAVPVIKNTWWYYKWLKFSY